VSFIYSICIIKHTLFITNKFMTHFIQTDVDEHGAEVLLGVLLGCELVRQASCHLSTGIFFP
jgi:hypothetical protein